ncbi:MAG: 30S ribosomal protein S17 [Gemmatales bacterium]|nr:30S ribosomal protein S17 [Gemmatales bacterium]MDW8175089.1 30S ribosomal protein S17 [Gemmatales bacterium]MDW8223238.1 30S ribosomal protein S17 [Gemmatales bacterium]
MRGRRKLAVGIVTSDKMNKTRRVEIPRLVRHPRYGKYIRRRTVCYVHDEQNVSRVGDTVKIMETRPLSKLKRWRLVEIIARAGAKRTAETGPLPTGGSNASRNPAPPAQTP